MKLTLYSAVWSVPDRVSERIARDLHQQHPGLSLEVVRFDKPEEIPEHVRAELPRHFGSPIWKLEGHPPHVGCMTLEGAELWLHGLA